MNTRRTAYLVGFVFAAILLVFILGVMGFIAVNGSFEMMQTIHASAPLLGGPSVMLHRCEFGDTIARTVHLSGETLLARMKDRRFTVRVEFDGHNGRARIQNKHTDLINRGETYRVRLIFDTQATQPDRRFLYTVEESV
jgi:hypothetical protein